MKKNTIHIIGHPACGKTTLMVDIIEALTKQGFKVGTIKHSAHSHELDKPGKDSFRMRKAGAVPAAMMTKDMAAIYLPRQDTLSPEDLIRQYFTESDIVLIEGWISGPHAKIEIFSNSCQRKPLFHEVSNVRAFVSDSPLSQDDRAVAATKNITVFSRTDIQQIVDFILQKPTFDKAALN